MPSKSSESTPQDPPSFSLTKVLLPFFLPVILVVVLLGFLIMFLPGNLVMMTKIYLCTDSEDEALERFLFGLF